MYRLFTTYKSLTLSLFFIFLFSVTVSFAAPLYNTTNTTLNPQCLPSDPDCTVQQSLFTGAINGQTLIGGTAASDTLTLSSTTNTTKGKIIFGTSAYDESTNRLGVGTVTPVNALDVIGRASITGPTLSSLPSVSVSHALFAVNSFGDSITVGTGASSPATTGYIPLLKNSTGWSFINNAAGYHMVPDQVGSVYNTTVYDTNLSTIMLGTNEESTYRIDANKLSVFKGGHQALLAWLAIPASKKVLGTSSSVTYSPGGWPVSAYGIGRYIVNSNGATATFSVTGTNVLIGMIQQNSNAGTYNVTIDGVLKGSFTTAPAGTMTTALGAGYGPRLLTFTGLTDTAHTVVITMTSATGSLYFDWAAGVGGTGATGGASVYVANIPYRSDAVYTSINSNSANTDAYNAAIASNVSELAAMGLNVTLVDVNSVVDPTTDLSDGTHPNDLGYQDIASAFSAVLNTSSSGSSQENPFTVTSNNNINSFILSKNTSSGTSAAAGIQLQNDDNKSAFIHRTSSGYTAGLTADTLYFINSIGDAAYFIGGGERMRILGSNGNVGINVANPTSKLQVNGEFSSTNVSGLFKSFGSGGGVSGTYGTSAFIAGPGPLAYTTGFNNYIIGGQHPGTNTITGYGLTSGVDNIIIGGGSGYSISTGSGNVVMGGYALSLATGGNNVAVGYQAGNGTVSLSGNNNIFLGASSGPTNGISTLTNAIAIGYNTKVSVSNTLVLGTGVSVGIGTSTPEKLLHVYNNSNNTTTANIFVQNNGTGTATGSGVIVGETTTGSKIVGLYYLNSSFTTAGTNISNSALFVAQSGATGGLVFRTDANAPIIFATSGQNNERMRILGSGFVGISNTAPGYLLHVGSSSTTTGTTVTRFQNAGGTCDVVPSTSGGITCSSDYTLKKNITTLSNTPWVYQTNTTDPTTLSILQKVLLLQPVQYNWNVESDTDTKHAGFIAQDVQQLFPELVTTDPTTNLLSLNYTGLLPYTIQALQDINIKVAAIPELTDKTLYTTIATFLDGIANRGEAVVNTLTSKKVNADMLCVGTACVTQEQFLQMIQQSNQQSQPSLVEPSTVSPETQTEASTETITEDGTHNEEVVAEEPAQEPVVETEPVPAE